ncbi:50S ribosomal protein L11 methyltransferase [Membranihabitans marinus]|uniref:50S ribosomal protein L11 methyltransferase n=1 Tax=Membranihabitans marinus TaxID=1227546 RepID=UPI001F0089BB|nr:50S ribosomal protein L11 methyltransferase [Membranihabitans marinus]
MDNHIKIIIDGVDDVDSLLGLLSLLPFEGFEEDVKAVVAYIPKEKWQADVIGEVETLAQQFQGRLTVEEIPFENWNQSWEEGYDEVVIDDICRIYAPFHTENPNSFDTEIQILPQMAFGTGHHETTEMMIRLMYKNKSSIEGKSCLDFGAGSGVLAIYAGLNGGKEIVAVEIDRYAALNMEENFAINHTLFIEGYCGDVSALPKNRQYDLILANVTRNVITEHLSFFKDSLLDGGKLLISGILVKDEDYMESAGQQHNFKVTDRLHKGKWCAMELTQK